MLVLSPLVTLLHFLVLFIAPHERLPQRFSPSQPLGDALMMLIATGVLTLVSLAVLLTR